jgi:alcohol dehydrogenase
MKAIMYNEFGGKIHFKNIPSPTCDKDGIIIKVVATGLCLSDWHGWMGHDKDISLPHVPGHELAGEVVEIGQNIKKIKVGDRVTVPFVGGCGKCEQCQNNNHQICDYQFQPGFTHWGSFAEYVSIHYADINVVKLPDSISFETAASMGCRFATSFRAVVDQGKVQSGQWVAVHGCGGVGLSAIMIASAMGARVIGIDINDKALAHAKSLGADLVMNVMENDHIPKKIFDSTNGGVHISIDAVGHPDILFNSVSSLRKRGKHIQIGILNPEVKNASIPTDLIIANELEILGSHGMQAFRYDEMIKMINEEKLKPEKLISAFISLEDVPELLPILPSNQNSGISIVNSF